MKAPPFRHLAVLASLSLSLASPAQDSSGDAGTLDKDKAAAGHKVRPYSPYADRRFPTRPFFGDTHLHTGFSMDAGAFGCRLSPRDAYRFARGEQIMASSGQPAKLSRPLDFLVVADHSDNMGFFPDLFAGKSELLAHPMGRKWYDLIQQGKGAEAALDIIGNFSQGTFPKELMYFPGTRFYKGAWKETVDAAETFNDPGHFTAFIGFEWTSLDKGNLDGSEAKKREMLEFEYARAALKNGLKLEEKLGTNPYKFGLVGSTDAHTGLMSIEEDNFFGKTSPQEPSPHRMTAAFMNNPKTGVKIMDWEVCSAGYAAVWAEENTRESLWDAMQRKETYATTGSRLTVRFFGGWDFAKSDANTRNPAVTGYTKGVPMGGDLQAAPEGRSPSFLVAAMKDPIGANLDRIQVVKGWLDAKGDLREKVHDVVWSGDRKPDANGKLPSVGSTVDIENATWTNTIGAPELITVWSDPDFDAKQRALYYLRVMEIPTPRWTAYDVKRFGVKPLPGTRLTIVERAYTSPIWYSPTR
jgi:hypothetical protein